MIQQAWARWRRFWNGAGRLRPVTATMWQALGFQAACRLRVAQGWPFRFQSAGQPFWARPADACALEEVLLNHEYRFVIPLVTQSGPPPVVIDAGANIGLFSLMVLEARPDAVVHSLEPGAPALTMLRRTWAVRHYPHWHLHPLALWREVGQLSFSNRAASTSSRLAVLGSSEGLATVMATTLPAFWESTVRGPVTLLKLDIEGAEEAVLSQGEAVLGQVAHLVVELHPAVVDSQRVDALLRRNFPRVERIGGRQSSKPLLWAHRSPPGPAA